MSASSEELSSQADSMRDTISFFKIDNNHRTDAARIPKRVSAKHTPKASVKNVSFGSAKGLKIEMDSTHSDTEYERH